MTIPKSNIRGIQEIRTLSGRTDTVAETYRIYMRLTCLEMEKARRAKERTSASHRVSSIDSRFKDIEAEKTELLKMLGDEDKARISKAVGADPKPVERSKKDGFRIKY